MSASDREWEKARELELLDAITGTIVIEGEERVPFERIVMRSEILRTRNRNADTWFTYLDRIAKLWPQHTQAVAELKARMNAGRDEEPPRKDPMAHMAYDPQTMATELEWLSETYDEHYPHMRAG